MALAFARLSVKCHEEHTLHLCCHTMVSPALNIFTHKGHRGENELVSRLQGKEQATKHISIVSLCRDRTSRLEVSSPSAGFGWFRKVTH